MPPYGEGRHTASSSDTSFVFKLGSRIVTACKIHSVVKFQVVENLSAKILHIITQTIWLHGFLSPFIKKRQRKRRRTLLSSVGGFISCGNQL